jgi:hypothetical protein
MDPQEYQRLAATTTEYPGSGEPLGLSYVVMGLNGEAKKCIRDDGIAVTDARLAKIMHSLGGNQWYAAQLCNELGIQLADVQRLNIDVLLSRKDRGVIRGDGEDR